MTARSLPVAPYPPRLVALQAGWTEVLRRPLDRTTGTLRAAAPFMGEQMEFEED